MPVIVNSNGVERLPLSATYFRVKSWRSSASSIAPVAISAAASTTHA